MSRYDESMGTPRCVNMGKKGYPDLCLKVCVNCTRRAKCYAGSQLYYPFFGSTQSLRYVADREQELEVGKIQEKVMKYAIKLASKHEGIEITEMDRESGYYEER